MMSGAGGRRGGVTEVEWLDGAMEEERYGSDSAGGWKGMVTLSCNDALWSFFYKWVVKAQASTLTAQTRCCFGKRYRFS